MTPGPGDNDRTAETVGAGGRDTRGAGLAAKSGAADAGGAVTGEDGPVPPSGDPSGSSSGQNAGGEPAAVGDKRRFFEDFVAGELFDLGAHTFGRDGVVGFAAAFDPQPFHLEEAAGKASMLGGLAASGWQVALVLNRAFEERVLAGAHARGILAVDRIRWLRPVLAGATLTAQARVCSLAAGATQSEADIDRAAEVAGVVGFALTGRDAEGRPAIEIGSRHRIARFAAAP